MSVNECDTRTRRVLSDGFEYERHLADSGSDEPTLSGGFIYNVNDETEEPEKILEVSSRKRYRNISVQCSLQKFEHFNKIHSGTQYEPAVLVNREIQCYYSDLVPGIEILPSTRRVCTECVSKCAYPRTSKCHVISSLTYNMTCNGQSKAVSGFDFKDNNYCKKNNSSVETCEQASYKYPTTEICRRELDVITTQDSLRFPNRIEKKCTQYLLKRRENFSSSSTSGIAETSCSRSEISQVNEGSIYSNNNTKRRKKHLWNPPSDTNTISDGDDVTVINYLFDTRPKVKEINSDSGKMTSVNIKKKYSTEEQLQIIKFIAEKNLYSSVGGVCMWHNMEAEMGSGRSWQSLKENFRKQILPNIEKYHLSSSVERSFREVRK